MTSQTNSQSAALLGIQSPRVLKSRPLDVKGVYLDRALAAIELSSAYGLTLDPWQETFVTHALAEDKHGRWLHPTAAQSVPRQNGKNGGIEAVELAALVLFGEQLVIHSAHEVKTSLEAFRRIRGFFENYDDLRKLVKAIRTTNGDEGIELLTGQRLRFMARSRSSGRGFSADRLILDEAQELAHSTFAAILPTMAARDNPQVMLTGTPPSPVNNGEVFSQIRSNALSGADSTILYVEHSADPELDHDEPLAARQANPALGIRISWETIERERAVLSDDDFGRERLGKWDVSGGKSVIPSDTWALQASAEPTSAREIALAVDVAPNRETASIGLAGWRDSDGKPQLEVADRRNGTGWIVDAVAGIYARQNVRAVVIDAAGPAASLIDPLTERGVLVTTTNAQQMAQACGTFYDGIVAGDLFHIDQPQLTTALFAARKRSLVDAWAWHRKADIDISPLVAVTLALYGLSASSVAKPKTKAKAVSHTYYSFQ